MDLKKTAFVGLMFLLSACDSDSPNIDLSEPETSETRLEDMMMLFQPDDLTYTGPYEVETLEQRAQKYGGDIIETDSIKEDENCDWWVFFEDQAYIVDYSLGTKRRIVFPEGGRLSGSFSLLTRGDYPKRRRYSDSGWFMFYLMDEPDGFTLGGLNQLGHHQPITLNVELPKESGPNIVVGKAYANHVAKVTRIARVDYHKNPNTGNYCVE
jgi:hypothetical protein